MFFAYNNKVVFVNLSSKETRVEEPGEKFFRTYLGGSAFALYYLLNGFNHAVDPLGPDNKLIFTSSALAGIPVAGFSRITIAAKSPLTGGFGEAEAGGWFSPELKAAGFDCIVIEGRADVPSYLWVHDGEVELRSAEELWGKDPKETQNLIRAELGDERIRVALIGRGGENLVRYACVINELKHANGRTGMGAVMGSKNLKAIAVRGKKRPRVYDNEGLKECSKRLAQKCREYPDSLWLHNQGTSGQTLANSLNGILPTHNFRFGQFDGAQDITGQTMIETILIGREGCYTCPIRCKRVVGTSGKYNVDPDYGGPEYETVAAFGSLCGVNDLKAIAKAHELANRYTIDSISLGASIAFAMECFENGLLEKDDAEGIDLQFGNSDAMLEMISMIAERRSLGNILAEGVMRASRKIGKGAEKYALHVKGQEIPMHEPRGKNLLALQYACSPTGADHLEAPHDPDFGVPDRLKVLSGLGVFNEVENLGFGGDKLRIFNYTQTLFTLYNCAGLCLFVGAPWGPLEPYELCEIVRAATGWNTSFWELAKIGERADVMARVFNYRVGLNSESDMLPDRMFSPLENGALKGVGLDREEFLKARKLYYEMKGWDEEGYPTEGKLQELDLGWLCE